MQVLPLLLPFLGAIVGAIIGATMSPLIQWQFEKKRQRLAYRRELIVKWRAMLEEVARDHDLNASPREIHNALVRKGDFLNLVARFVDVPIELTPKEIQHARDHNLHPVLSHYLGEIIRLEQKWDLL